MKSRSVVFRQGERSEDLYLILDGSVSVIVDDTEGPEQEMVVSYLNLGEFFGEMGLFIEEHRTANLVTRTPCEFGRTSYQDFHAIRQQFSDVLYALTAQIWQRLKKYDPQACRSDVYRCLRTYSSVTHSAHHIARGHDPP